NASAVSPNPRPDKHQEAADKETQTAKPLQPEPTVPLRNLVAAQAATLDAISALHAEQEARAKDSRAKDEAFYANLISLGLLVVGVVYSFFAWKQWAAIKEQARIARASLAANRLALNSARRSTDAAKESAETAEKTLRLAERAWVSIQVDRLDDLVTIEKWREMAPIADGNFRIMVAVKFRFINSGKTPARLTHSGVKFTTVVEANLPESFDKFGYSGGSQRSVLIAPNYPYEVAKVTYLNQTTIRRLLDGIERLIFYGFVRYLDVLDKPHETRFCMMGTFKKGEPPTFGVDGPPSYNYF